MTRHRLFKLIVVNGFAAVTLGALAVWYAVDGDLLAIVWAAGALCFVACVVLNVLTLRYIEGD